MSVPDTTTIRRSAECVWSGAENPAGNFCKGRNGPCAGSPKRLTALTPGGAPSASVHFRSPAGQTTGAGADILGAGFAFPASDFCARAAAASTNDRENARTLRNLIDRSPSAVGFSQPYQP